ncbi:hypothetical protein [Actinophytocola algeriensis]|uniref:Uncharacterized protein n=1 Tax=Actinophytocola algeriensis TaxID=1768010 RepID=A0A7W7VC14_9PSEU|nr:hypothetical protein [Actinophytocola algeriensis]MBB4904619.1 hypothetical protein [Actinophytocola algeriensis]MBE1476522.1 hypothetical protein [Actinophytocola algeriensis]
MPDIGGFGRGLLKGALSATEKAAEKVKDAAESASRRMTDDDDPDATQIVRSGDTDATQVVPDDDPDITQVIPGSQTTGSAAPQSPRPAPAGLARHGSPARPRPGPLTPQGGFPGSPPGAPLGSAPGVPRAFPSAPGPQAPAAGLATPPGGAFPAGPQGGPPPQRFAGPATPQAGVPQAAPPNQAPAASRGDEPSLADEPEDHADAAEVQELVEMFQQLLARRRPPSGPIPGDWSIGVGDLLAEHPKVPKRVRGLVVKLNRFGGIAYSPQEVAFDGDDVPWEKVTEVRTRHVVDYLVGDAVQQQVENLPMPWFPGRKRLLDALGQALLTVTIATAKDQLEKFELDLRVPAEVVYKASFGRSKELNAGVVSALVLADPAVNQSLIATARAHGITVTSGDDELLANADERADKIREKVKALEAELDRFTARFGRSG